MHDKTIDELQAMIDDARQELTRRTNQKRNDAIKQIRELADSIGVSVRIDAGNVMQIPPGVKTHKSTKGRKVPAKFRNPKTGEEWSGRGIQPKWLRRELEDGATIESFMVAA